MSRWCCATLIHTYMSVDMSVDSYERTKVFLYATNLPATPLQIHTYTNIILVCQAICYLTECVVAYDDEERTTTNWVGENIQVVTIKGIISVDYC